MKNVALILVAVLLAAGCSSRPRTTAVTPGPVQPQTASAKKPADGIRIQDQDGVAVVQKVEFRSGVSSAIVEKLGQRFGCTPKTGAGLITEKGPVEVYRMQCENGTTFMAQCELRQCRPMR